MQASLTTARPAPLRRIRMLPGQALEVGRSNRAAVAMEYDRSMADVHFALECDLRAFRLRDLNSGRGTFVNGANVDEAVLYNGDRVVAGDTEFLVELDGFSSSPPASRPDGPQVTLDDSHAVGAWRFMHIPDLWESGNYGLRRVSRIGEFPTQLIAGLSPSADPNAPARHLQVQIDGLLSAIPDLAVVGPDAIDLRGADEAWEAHLVYPDGGEFGLSQRLTYGRRADLVWAARLDSSEVQMERLASEFAQIRAGMVLAD